MNLPLLKYFIKKNWKIWAIFTAIHIFYLSVITAMSTDPLMRESMEFLNMGMGGGMLSDVFIAQVVSGMAFFGLIVFVFSMIYYVIMSHKLAHKAVDSTTLSSHLSSSISRRQYIVTAAVFLAGSLFVLYLILFTVSSVILSTFGSFNVGLWAAMVLTVFLCSLAVAMISFTCSTVFAGSKTAMPLLAGIPIAFGMFMMLSTYIEFFKWFTPFRWFKAGDIGIGMFDTWWVFALGFAAVSAVLFVICIKVFERKQLSI